MIEELFFFVGLSHSFFIGIKAPIFVNCYNLGQNSMVLPNALSHLLNSNKRILEILIFLLAFSYVMIYYLKKIYFSSLVAFIKINYAYTSSRNLYAFYPTMAV